MTTNSPSATGDLNKLWQGLCNAWREMPTWPAFAWLGSEVPVRCLHADGTESTWLSDGHARRRFSRPGRRLSGMPFVAVALPEDLVLRRTVTLPAMADSDAHEALKLNALGASPFAVADLVWGYVSAPSAAGQRVAELVIASRRQTEAYVAQCGDRLRGVQAPLVWVIGTTGAETATELPGFGESRVQAHNQTRRWIAYALVGLALGLMAAMAVTHTAQLRLTAIEANDAYFALVEKTKALTKKRGELQALADKVTALKDLTADNTDPLRLMSRLTDVLPDDTNLVSLTVQGRKISLYGQTPNAAALMQLLSAHEGFRDVKAPVAAIRPSGGTKDTFTIEFTLAPEVPEMVVAKSANAASAPKVPALNAPAPQVPASGVSVPVAPAPAATSPASAKTTSAPRIPSPPGSPGAPAGGATFGGAAAKPPVKP